MRERAAGWRSERSSTAKSVATKTRNVMKTRNHNAEPRSTILFVRSCSFVISWLTFGAANSQVLAGLASPFLEQANRSNHDAFINCLHHVVQRERGDCHRGERFHFNAGLRRCSHARFDRVAGAGWIDLDPHVRQRQRVAERNEL